MTMKLISIYRPVYEYFDDLIATQFFYHSCCKCEVIKDTVFDNLNLTLIVSTYIISFSLQLPI